MSNNLKFLDELITELESSLKLLFSNIAKKTYIEIVNSAKSSLSGANLEAYLNSLKFEQISEDSWVISLEGDFANQLESGQKSFDLRKTLLNSKKLVSTGSRAGKPWVQTSKKGYKFAHVPFKDEAIKRPKGASDLASAIKSLQGRGIDGTIKNINSIFVSPTTGKPLTGKAATAINVTDQNLKGMVKYQEIKAGKVVSFYHVYRTISNNPKSRGWIRKEQPGIEVFDKIDTLLNLEIKKILDKI